MTTGAMLGAVACTGRVDLGGPNDAHGGDAGFDAQLPDSGLLPDSGARPDSGAPPDSGGEAGVSTACASSGPARTPLASEVTPWTTESEFRALVVGQWIQYEGQCLNSQEVGLEYTQTHLYKLARLEDGTLVRLSQPQTWFLKLDEVGWGGPCIGFDTASGCQDQAPSFFKSGTHMRSLLYPWYVHLTRVP